MVTQSIPIRAVIHCRHAFTRPATPKSFGAGFCGGSASVTVSSGVPTDDTWSRAARLVRSGMAVSCWRLACGSTAGQRRMCRCGEKADVSNEQGSSMLVECSPATIRDRTPIILIPTTANSKFHAPLHSFRGQSKTQNSCPGTLSSTLPVYHLYPRVLSAKPSLLSKLVKTQSFPDCKRP